MGKAGAELKEIENLYNIAIDLLDKNSTDFALMYCKKIVEGISLILQGSERSSLNKIKRIISESNIQNGDDFIEKLKTLQDLGNRAIQFNFEEPQIENDANTIKEMLVFVFTWFNNFLPAFHARKNTDDLFFDTNNSSLPFCIKNIEIENYQSLKNVALNEIPVDCKFVVLTGDNGEGKTSILQVITIGMYGDSDENSGTFLCNNPLTYIAIEAKFNDKTILSEYNGHGKPFTKIENTKHIVAYGASRLQLQSSDSQEKQKTRQSNIYGIFKTDNVLLNIEYWIQMLVLNKQKARVDAVIALLIKLMPSIEHIIVGESVSTDSSELNMFFNEYPIVYIENGTPRKAEQLSAGNKSILAMIGDMIIRLYASQPETINPSELYGVVLIDELETHLHPKWQKELPKLLTDNFPLIQFFVSTHSAIVFLGMPKNSVFYNITKNDEKETVAHKLNIDIENILPNQILTSSLFGMENIRNVYNKGIEVLSVETEIEKKERLKMEQRLKDLSHGFNFQLPQE